MPESVPGKLDERQTYNDLWLGWPVSPVHEQHPVRGSFLDPRADRARGAIYHEGVDVAVRDDQPEAGAPRGRTHRVYAIEGGIVEEATPHGQRGHVHVGHFGYGHIDPTVRRGDRVRAGEMIGWTWHGDWHVHLSEFLFTHDGRRLVINPLRPGGKVRPFVDTAPPIIHEIRFYTPATPRWRRRPTNVAYLPPAGTRLDARRLAGVVDIRARADDPQSFVGWFRDLPQLAAPHHPFRLRLVIAQVATGRLVLRRDVFWSEQLLSLPAGQHYAPGTEQNLVAGGCLLLQPIRCRGVYWFRVAPRPYWDTRRVPNGRYRIRVRAWDARGNRAAADAVVNVRN